MNKCSVNLIPAISHNNYGSQTVMFHLLFESVLLEFDHYLEI
jgi:hypothetical protein